ncbi:MAG: ABC transporter ATP-binding protein [Planctomycetota bacterium]
MREAISINGISKKFGRIQALDSVSFDVPIQSISGLLGPNGAGKTTLLSIIANFLKAHCGTVEVLGVDNRRISQLKGRLSILPQDAQFQRNVPIIEQLIFFQRLEGQLHSEAKKEVMAVLDMVGLGSVAKRRVGSLSHGMLKTLGIAQAFLGKPQVILLDEPTSGLDPANVHRIRNLIKQLQKRATIMVSSHNLAEIQELCDHVAILDKGKLILAGPVDEITRAGRECKLTLSRQLKEIELQQLCSIDAVGAIKPVDGQPNLQVENSPEYLVTLDFSGSKTDQDTVIAGLMRNILDMGITPRKLAEGQTLETHFLELTGEGNGTGQ